MAQLTNEERLAELNKFSSIQYWTPGTIPAPNHDALVSSIMAARQYYLCHQKEDGNFIYLMDISTGEQSEEDNQVRQAGALWGLVCIHQHFPTDETRNAIIRGFDFVERNMQDLPCGKRCFVYPGMDKIDTGTIALYSLALLDFYLSPDLNDEQKAKYDSLLNVFLEYLQSMEAPQGYWNRRYIISENRIVKGGSPYYDGEALLAYCKASRFAQRQDLMERINFSLPLLIDKYVLVDWNIPEVAEQLKGFYQWSSMAFDQYISAGWKPHAEIAARAAITMAYWQIFKNRIGNKNGNVGYAVEGLAAALHIAKLVENQQTIDILTPEIKNIMPRLLCMQYKGPFSDLNPKFSTIEKEIPEAAGGITSSFTSFEVRIDTVQHQAHATLMLLDYLY